MVFNPFNANWEKHAPKKKTAALLSAAEEIKRRADLLAELIIHGPLPPDNPLLRPMESESVARRTASRLRSGVIEADDPTVDSFELADEVEQTAECRKLVRLVENELTALDALLYKVYSGLTTRFLELAHATYESEVRLVKADPSQPHPDAHIRRLEKSLRTDIKSLLHPQFDAVDAKRRQRTKKPPGSEKAPLDSIAAELDLGPS